MRIIAKLDVKPPFVVKPVHFEGLRKVGLPHSMAETYYIQGADEIMYIDIVASLYQREILFSQAERAVQNVFVPVSIGGGIRSIEDCSTLFHLGADKVVLNTFALQQYPELIDHAVSIFGAQSVVINIEAKRWGRDQNWECFSDCGRIRSRRSVLDWVNEVQERGAGEILIQSVDKDGRQRGFDIQLIQKVVQSADVPVVAASGAGTKEHILEVASEAKPSGIALASLLHYKTITIKEVKKFLLENGIEVSK